jgi:hypothetical protein
MCKSTFEQQKESKSFLSYKNQDFEPQHMSRSSTRGCINKSKSFPRHLGPGISKDKQFEGPEIHKASKRQGFRWVALSTYKHSSILFFITLARMEHFRDT